MAFVVQRIVDDYYYNGFRHNSWSKSVVCALAFDSKAEAQDEMTDRGWRGVRYLVLPRVRRSPEAYAKLRPS